MPLADRFHAREVGASDEPCDSCAGFADQVDRIREGDTVSVVRSCSFCRMAGR